MQLFSVLVLSQKYKKICDFIKKTSKKICTLKKNFIPLQPKILVTKN